MGQLSSEREQPTLKALKKHLGENPNTIFIGEFSEPWSFKPSPEDDYEVLEATHLLVAPFQLLAEQHPLLIDKSQELTEFTHREIVDQFRLHDSSTSEARWSNDSFVLPHVSFSETVGIERRAGNIEAMDPEILLRYGKIKDYRYQRQVNVTVYPSVDFAYLYRRFLNSENRGPDNLPPGTQNDLNSLWTRVTPQLWQRVTSDGNFHKFYFDSNGNFIPRFYRMPEASMDFALGETPKGALFPSRLFTEVFKVVGGAEEAARLYIYRRKYNLDPTSLAENSFLGKSMGLKIKAMENGLLPPDTEMIKKIMSFGLSADQYDKLRIYPAGYSSLPRRQHYDNGLRIVAYHDEGLNISRTDINPFGSLVREFRGERSLSQTELAKGIGSHQADISLLERGAKKNLAEDSLRRLAIVLKLNATETIALIRAFEKQYSNLES